MPPRKRASAPPSTLADAGTADVQPPKPKRAKRASDQVAGSANGTTTPAMITRGSSSLENISGTEKNGKKDEVESGAIVNGVDDDSGEKQTKGSRRKRDRKRGSSLTGKPLVEEPTSSQPQSQTPPPQTPAPVLNGSTTSTGRKVQILTPSSSLANLPPTSTTGSTNKISSKNLIAEAAKVMESNQQQQQPSLKPSLKRSASKGGTGHGKTKPFPQHSWVSGGSGGPLEDLGGDADTEEEEGDSGEQEAKPKGKKKDKKSKGKGKDKTSAAANGVTQPPPSISAKDAKLLKRLEKEAASNEIGLDFKKGFQLEDEEKKDGAKGKKGKKKDKKSKKKEEAIVTRTNEKMDENEEAIADEKVGETNTPQKDDDLDEIFDLEVSSSSSDEDEDENDAVAFPGVEALPSPKKPIKSPVKSDNANGGDLNEMEMTDAERAKLRIKLEKAGAVKSPSHTVLYLGRLPHGFTETAIQAYFSQFGTITHLRVSRNRKTGSSRHYCFIEFENDKVGEIVQETMDGYLLCGHLLRCSIVPPEEVHEDIWEGEGKTFKPVLRYEERRKHNAIKSPTRQIPILSRLLSRSRSSQSKAQELGIDYDFSSVPGYTSILPSPSITSSDKSKIQNNKSPSPIKAIAQAPTDEGELALLKAQDRARKNEREMKADWEKEALRNKKIAEGGGGRVTRGREKRKREKEEKETEVGVEGFGVEELLNPEEVEEQVEKMEVEEVAPVEEGKDAAAPAEEPVVESKKAKKRKKKGKEAESTSTSITEETKPQSKPEPNGATATTPTTTPKANGASAGSGKKRKAQEIEDTVDANGVGGEGEGAAQAGAKKGKKKKPKVKAAGAGADGGGEQKETEANKTGTGKEKKKSKRTKT